MRLALRERRMGRATISRLLIHSLSSESEDDSEEEDCVLAEIGISSSEEEEKSTEEGEEMIESTENFNVNMTIVLLTFWAKSNSNPNLR